MKIAASAPAENENPSNDSYSQVGSLPWYLAFPAAALGGYALDAATPSLEWWPAALIGVGLVLGSVWQKRAITGLALGAIAGAAFWLPHISWLTLYLGPIPWLALSAVMIAWFSAFGMLASIATRGLRVLLVRAVGGTQRFTGRLGAIVLVIAQSLTVAGLWVAREQVQSVWPYGGFAWGRVSHTQADGPLVALVSWLGFAGLSALMVFFVALVVATMFSLRTRTMRERSRVTADTNDLSFSARDTIALLLAFALTACVLTIVPPAAVAEVGSIKIAAVQGNSKSAIFDDRENGDVFRNHADATALMLDRLEAAGEGVDIIVWPENSGEFQLPEQTFRALEVQRLSERAGAPLVTGSVLMDSDEVFTNSSIVFDASGYTGERYDKRRPVPFAEYMPNRNFFRALAPDLVDLVQLDYAFGTRSAVLPVETAAGELQAAIAICFDIIFDDHAVAMMRDDAQIILAQTNNADFGNTDESAQQLQIARLRAVETGRTLVNISTVGTSAIVMRDGSIGSALTPFTTDAMVLEVPLYEGQTPALRFGAVIAGFWIAVGVAGTGVAIALGSSRRAQAG